MELKSDSRKLLDPEAGRLTKQVIELVDDFSKEPAVACATAACPMGLSTGVLSSSRSSSSLPIDVKTGQHQPFKSTRSGRFADRRFCSNLAKAAKFSSSGSPKSINWAT